MADRIALAIEPDNATADQLRRALEPKGFEVKNIPNGDDAMEWGRTHKPAIIILSVEPRKIGYAISNKLRRSPSLREVPLVLISSEETLATFEQHKKLKSRADEYLLKPWTRLCSSPRSGGWSASGPTGARAKRRSTSWTRTPTSSSPRRKTSTSSAARTKGRCSPTRTTASCATPPSIASRRRCAGRSVRGGEVRSRDPGRLRGAGGGLSGEPLEGRRHGRFSKPVVGRRPAAEPGMEQPPKGQAGLPGRPGPVARGGSVLERGRRGGD